MLFLALSVAQAIASAPTPQWNVNDVSFLYPLPKTPAETTNLRADEVGTRGVVFPDAQYKKLAPAVRSLNVATERSRLRAVGVRIDPCGEDSDATRGICNPEIRIVWQPLNFLPSGTMSEDGAFHSFYRLSPQEWTALKKDLESLKSSMLRHGVSTDHAALDVHPAFKNPRTRVAFANALRAIWLRYCGEKNFFQVTVMREESAALWYKLEGLKKSNGAWSSLGIPRTHSDFQDFFNDSHDLPRRGSDISKELKSQNLPQYSGEDSLEPFIRGYHQPSADNRADFRKGVAITHRLENPARFNTANLDCVHCHLAAPARFYFKANVAGAEVPGVTDRDRYIVPSQWLRQATQTTTSGKSTKNLRAFGYYFELPSVSQRVIHESIRVAERMTSSR